MRSGLIFRASDHVSNRFLLCRMISTSARKMHRDGVSMSQSINRSLLALESATQTAAEEAPPPAAEPEPAIAES